MSRAAIIIAVFALLNTEMGLIVESPALAKRLGETFDTAVPLIAYEVQLAPDGRACNGSSGPLPARRGTIRSRQRAGFCAGASIC
jgi:hypothetical protein